MLNMLIDACGNIDDRRGWGRARVGLVGCSTKEDVARTTRCSLFVGAVSGLED